MPTNVEIKASLTDRERALNTAARLSDSGREIIHQQDIFFRCQGARLKLRIFAVDRGELIRYQRDDVAEVRCSQYSIARTSDPSVLVDILTKTLGQLGTVRKTRTLYRVGQTRIHIDQVEGLGDFLELEVVLRIGQTEMEGKGIAEALLREFGIEQKQLIGTAYIDLLARQP